MNPHTFAELRAALGFGPRRLKVLLWLKAHPELEDGQWEFHGRMGIQVAGNMNGGGSVKIGLYQMLEVLTEAST